MRNLLKSGQYITNLSISTCENSRKQNNKPFVDKNFVMSSHKKLIVIETLSAHESVITLVMKVRQHRLWMVPDSALPMTGSLLPVGCTPNVENILTAIGTVYLYICYLSQGA